MINTESIRKQLQAFDFRKLFIELLGWDKVNSDALVEVDKREFRLQAVAQKRGLVVFHCQIADGQALPDYAMRRKIEAQVRKTFHEHLIIFSDQAKTLQKWQWVRREPGKPSAGREFGFQQGQTAEALVQRLQALVFGLQEEASLTIVDVTRRVRAGFDLERVTKKFYEKFKSEHAAFLKFLSGIPDEDMQRWYASVTINRLMFVYFIQRKGFLDGDPNYLRSHLERTRRELGDNHYYRDFLCPLFFEGFAKKEHPPKTKQLLGTVPYLSGSIFERHQLEERFGLAIDIPDAAFARIFEFFDGYNWHLDERPLRADDEINPDVLGFIFEKYINQKQMGAYYTKEDITGYIARNTILPALFERARKECRIAFEGENSVWNQLAADPERYIYPAMRKGLNLPLPEAIAAGQNDVARRGEWNRPADEAYALPTEIWRETVARRDRTQEVRGLLAAGQVREINDLITYNLDIQQFAQDVIEDSEGPELVRAYWKGLTELKVLDPTCGSGAFLFAALNILEPLYEACLDRMQSFVDDLDAATARGAKAHPEKYADFRRILAQVAKHPNRAYFIYKSIIVQNLYGVDIMEEATEICKLRLFLKLIAQVDSVKVIEPLPDIDFNVRAGNTLVGFTNREEVRKALTTQGGQGMLGLFGENDAADKVEEQAELADKAFTRFRQMQTDENMDGTAFSAAKAELRKRLGELNEQLNRALALHYLPAPVKEDAYDKWLAAYTPFHWFVDFFGIMKSGGFDVIIGNPPYVEYRVIKNQYHLLNGHYQSEETGNLYAFCMEKSTNLLKNNGAFGMIVPVGVLGLDQSYSLRTLLLKRFSSIHCSSFSVRPSKLFEGVDQRLCIFLGNPSSLSKRSILTTKYQRWYSEERPVLFQKIYYSDSYLSARIGRIPQVEGQIAVSVLEKIEEHKEFPIKSYYSPTERGFLIHYHRSPNYWIRSMDFEPYFKSPTKNRSTSHFRDLIIKDQNYANLIGAAINSSLFFFWFMTIGNGRNVTSVDIEDFPLGQVDQNLFEEIKRSFSDLMEDYKKNSQILVRKETELQEFHPSVSKPLINIIDMLLGIHYDFSEEEKDFILNYDIKYRMGDELGEDDEE